MLSFKDISKYLLYDSESGKLFWKSRERCEFNNTGTFKAWNKRWAGKEAFTAIDNNGYRIGRFRKKNYRTHTLAWLLHYKEWPEEDKHIDHIDHDKTNNSIKNLRLVTNSENMRNAKLSAKNTSGHTGVYYNKRDAKWVSQIKVMYKVHVLGRYDCIEDAVFARKDAEKKYKFHEKHGT